MSRKKLVITGASGFLGSRTAQYYESRYEVLAPSHRELDLCQDAAVQRYLEKERPDYVFHCAAVSDTGRCQQEPEETQRLNVTAVGFLAKACNLVGAKLIFCSSDQIYFGAPGIEAHREEDAVSPVNVYGQQKLEAEQLCMEWCPEAVCLRLSWMYDRKVRPGEHGNFLATFLQAVKLGESVCYPIYDYRGLTDVNLVIKELEKTFCLPGGIYNYGSVNHYSTYETVQRVMENCGFPPELLQKNERAFAQAPRNLCMNGEKAKQYGISFPDTAERLIQVIKDKTE